MITLRDYQQDCINKARGALREHKRVMLQAPTGAGKTAMAAYMAQQSLQKGNKFYFICHRRELLDQTALTFDKVGMEYSYIAAGYDHDPEEQIQICSIDTLKNRLDKIDSPDICVWDEAHHLGAAGWSRVQEAWRCYHIGLSATPQRLDGKGLDDRFDFLVLGPSVEWLISQGYLAQYRLFSVPGVDLSGVRTKMGDYDKQGSQDAMSKPAIVGDIVKHWRQLASDKLTIGFAVSVAHSERLCEAFVAEGIPAAHLDGKTPKEQRRDVLRRFATGDIRVLFNVGLFGEGFDIAANSGLDVTVGCVIDAAPTQALGMWLQRCGRALRKQEDKAIILDHAGNALRHGMPDQPRGWTLRGREKKTRAGSTEPDIQMRQCGECYHCHAPSPACPCCGYVYTTKGRTIEERAGELVEMQKTRAKREQKREQQMARTLDDLIALGRARGYKNPGMWASKIYTSRRAR